MSVIIRKIYHCNEYAYLPSCLLYTSTALFVDYQMIMEELCEMQVSYDQVIGYDTQISKLQEEYNRYYSLKASLGDDLKEGLISKAEFDDFRESYGRKCEELEQMIENQKMCIRDRAVDEAQKKQKEAEKKMEQAETKARNEKKRAELEIRKAKKEVKARTEKMRDTEYFWGMGYITVILFVIIQNGAFQNDFIDFFRTPFMWYFQFCEWLAHPTYDNGFNQKIAYTCGEAWVIRILAIVAVLLIVVIIMAIIMEIIKIYKKMWDKISQMFLIGSLSGIAVLGDVIREYLPVNLILTFGFINVGIMLLKMYFQKKFEEKSLYADNHYD